MTQKSLKEVGNKNPTKPQKYKWTQKKRFDNFNDADKLRNKLKKEGNIVKVKRCGPEGCYFKVITGTLLKDAKGSKNATK
jgi:predicted secreted protein